jgi:hypothetical protein
MYQIDEEFRAEVEKHKWYLSVYGYWHRNRLKATVGPRLMHRFVWWLKHGTIPPILDHINGDKQDNRIANLRPATPRLNALNRSSRRNGIQPRPRKYGGTHWIAFVAGRTLGTFATKESAEEYYFSCRAKLMEYEEALARGESPEPPVIERAKPPVGSGRPAKKFVYDPARVVELYNSGRSTTSISRELAVREDHIRACLKAAGIKLRRGRLPRPEPSGSPSQVPSSLASLLVCLLESRLRAPASRLPPFQPPSLARIHPSTS